ncbi:unnamed protein product [Adineta ricciae]|uniref:Uncharacterized protein n=1 Tax=Adineta ricciae TaxID=249248 RepID=A0A814WHS2_ADIRI|nr:unnamed protein product [Adineta ricciae]CAF1428285.1 unnamed protein product [Adineta ricciae]
MKTDGSSELLEILKRYYLEKWKQIPIEWFQNFTTWHQSQEDVAQYEAVLLRSAEYGMKFLKTCPAFSIVLQIVFVFDDDVITEDNVFYDIWSSFTMYGYDAALDQSNKYLIPSIKKKYNNAYDNVLFYALWEYFREPMVNLYNECKIKLRRNLLHITLNSLAKLGWNGGLEDNCVIEFILEVQYKNLISKHKKYLIGNQLSNKTITSKIPSNSDTPSYVPSSKFAGNGWEMTGTYV